MEFLQPKRWECVRRRTVMALCHKQEFLHGTECLKRAERAFKTSHVPDGHPHQLMWFTSKKSEIWCSQIVDWLSETLLILLAYRKDQSKPFWATIWASEKWKRDWCQNRLHHDNAPSHTSLVVRDHFAKNSTHIIPQPPYSPDLAPCDFWLFSKLKRPLRGHRFETIEEIKEKTTSELRAIPTDDYAACFENWKKRWHSCIATGGDYFEGDDTNLDE